MGYSNHHITGQYNNPYVYSKEPWFWLLLTSVENKDTTNKYNLNILQQIQTKQL